MASVRMTTSSSSPSTNDHTEIRIASSDAVDVRTMRRLAEQFTAAAGAARNTAAVDEIARLTWRAHSEGQLTDADAEAIGETLQARRAVFGTTRRPSVPRPAAAILRPARSPRSPNRRASKVAGGEITPNEARSLSNLIGNTAKAIETFELSERLARLEEQISAKGSGL
jgi:hypothetical protein